MTWETIVLMIASFLVGFNAGFIVARYWRGNHDGK